MVDSSAGRKVETENRRSSRVVQAVPLSVTAVDALGRPFVERTSTVNINCHGCRYQSRHYVLKNMWLTLEVPHIEQAHAPRQVRARVVTVERPGTVRDLFQVSVELETPGNLWGIAFSPSDWVPFADTSFRHADAPMSTDVNSSPAGQPQNDRLASELPHEDNLRSMPVPSKDKDKDIVSVTLARQMDHLVDEAKQQLHQVIRESATQALSTEAHPLIAALHAQFQEGNWLPQQQGRTGEPDIRGQIVQARERIAEQAREAGEAALIDVREQWSRELGDSVRQAHERLAEQFGQLEQERRAGFEQQIVSSLNQASETLRGIANDVNLSLQTAQDHLDEFRRHPDQAAAPLRELEANLRAQTANLHEQMERFQSETQKFEQTIASLLAGAESTWQDRLEAGLANAATLWNERLEMSLENAARRAEQEFSHRSQEACRQIENETALRMAAIARGFTENSVQIEQTINDRVLAVRKEFAEMISRQQASFAQLQASLDAGEQYMREAVAHVDNVAASFEQRGDNIEVLAKRAQAEFEKHVSSVMQQGVREFEARAEERIGACVERLHPALQAAGEQTVSSLAAQFETDLKGRLKRSEEMLERLDRATHEAKEMSRTHQDRLATLGDQAVQRVTHRLDEIVTGFQSDLERLSHGASTKYIGEIDGKSTEITHATFESLFKTAEWYEKKVQSQMQAALAKGLEHSAEVMRETAADMSRLFATELDHSSRNYVEHTRSQFEEVARETLERACQESGKMASSAAASFEQQTQNHMEAVLAKFGETLRRRLLEFSMPPGAQDVPPSE